MEWYTPLIHIILYFEYIGKYGEMMMSYLVWGNGKLGGSPSKFFGKR